MNVIALLMAVVGVILVLIIALICFFIKTSIDEKKQNNDNKNEEKEESKVSNQAYNKQSIFDFMEFEKIEDNMIIQKNGKRYLMVLECQGINYDLMSGMERAGVESGFMQFLNSLRYPIQIYTQTRTINLENSLESYKKRLDNIKLELERKELRYKQMQESSAYSEEALEKQNLEIIKDRNLYEYGKDIIFYTEKMSLNKNVLRKQYYVIIPYYSAEAGNDLLDKDEIRNLAFSELYTKAQSLARVLSGCSVTSRILDSYDLADLLYTAYNRDEAETYGLEKAWRAGYDELYSTAPDVLDKKIELLDKQIEEKAYELAQSMVNEAKTEKEKILEKTEESLDDLIKDMAIMIINENEQYIGEEVAEEAARKVQRRKTKDEGGKASNGKKESKTTKRVSKRV